MSIFWIGIIALWALPTIVAAYAASQKGRDTTGIFLLSIFASPLVGLLFVIALPDLKSRKIEQERHDELIGCLRKGTA
jgi:hypothetical protein